MENWQIKSRQNIRGLENENYFIYSWFYIFLILVYNVYINSNYYGLEIHKGARMEELNTQIKVLENYINDVPLVVDPCPMCDYIDADKQGHTKNRNICTECCYYYNSKFKTGGRNESNK